MKKTEVKRQQIVERVADHLLAQGMQASGLRALAAAAGTSDRMLLHYFANKEELMTAALNCVSARMLALLAIAGAGQAPFGTLLVHLAEVKNDPAVRPYLRLWLELAALSAAGEEAYRSIARQIGDGFYQWLAASLQVEREEARAPMAALAFAVVEGFVFLDAIDESSLIARAVEGIDLLTTGATAQEGPARAALEQTLRAIFEALNRVHLADNEFSRLLEQILTPDVFTVARTLRERNSSGRDDNQAAG